jgi:hypothetical protein
MPDNTNREGDLVLIYYEDNPAVYARIESVEPDIKKSWYQVTILLLTVPAQTVTWILREEYINGALFTMGGRSMRLERVKPHSGKTIPKGSQRSLKDKVGDKSGKVIPFRKE